MKAKCCSKISRELLRSYRNPMDVAYALNEIYSGIYPTQEGTRSLTLMVTTETNSPYHYLKRSTWPNTAGKTELKAMGCGQGKESRVLTIHEAQGLASKMWTSGSGKNWKKPLAGRNADLLPAIARERDRATNTQIDKFVGTHNHYARANFRDFPAILSRGSQEKLKNCPG
ncbi:hypothetical protein EVAR_16189_1 [Eumeta japonica]|uniref:Uncharacterized protein n=1 Tax=Eumeta variegata TaxID=151549 RepID=A0A4C1WC92_EUMVA|nr:hypothetical protein EVAR_16189_1 [Eumeta japonica]